MSEKNLKRKQQNDQTNYISGEKKTEAQKKVKFFGAIALGIVGVLLLIYLLLSAYFIDHFFVNTTINGVKFSGKSVKAVENYFMDRVKGYELTVLEKDQAEDVIRGSDISLAYEKNDDLKKALQKQNAFSWPAAIFSKKSLEVEVAVAYDEEALNQKIEEMQCLKAEQIAPVSAKPKFDGEKYVIEPEVIGTQVNKEVLKEKVHTSISRFQEELDMEAEGCYQTPKFTEESEEVKKAAEVMNTYSKASITYDMNPYTEVVDKTLITTWLTVDDEMNVTFDSEAVKTWLSAFGDKYDTQGTTRSFTTPSGKSATVTGGTYGWSVDEETELENLQNNIKNGEVVTREPAYYLGGRAATHAMPDWGNTYAEVDLSAQYMWYVVDGVVALETSVVTGEPIPEKETPSGTYDILAKSLNETLVGEVDPATGKPEYETPVSYWMRITWTGIGFHDAGWQSAFGGTLYQTPGIGSHGCINMPPGMASSLYNMIPVGTPVIMHY